MLKSLPLFTLCLFATKPLVAQESSSFEKKMNDIYQSAYSKEVGDAEWGNYVNKLNQKTYIVTEGDTLWGMSQVFFGDGFYWSKIWSFNSRLTNPHLIKVGQSIQFFTGSLDNPPEVTVAPENGGVDASFAKDEQRPGNIPKGFKVVVMQNEQGEPQTAIVKDSGAGNSSAPAVSRKKEYYNVDTGRLYPGAPKIPPPRKGLRPVMEILPSSFQNADSYDSSQYNENGISFDIRPPVRVNPQFVAHSFLYDGDFKKYPRVGRLIEAENNSVLVGLNQKVYLRSDADLKLGERFTVMGRDYHFDRNGFAGDVIKYMGTVEVDEKVRDKVFRGTIIRSLSGIKGSPWLSNEDIPKMNDDFVGRPGRQKLRVIGGGSDNSSRIYGQSDVVFLDGGANKGVRVGDIFGIYKRRDLRYKGVAVDKAPTPIGHLKVFRAEPNLSTAFVINSHEVIFPGDETGEPTVVEAVTTESERKDLDTLESGLDFATDEVSAEGESLEAELSDIQ